MSPVRLVLLTLIAGVGGPAAAEPPTDLAARVRIDRDLAMFRGIRDNAPFPWTARGEKPVEQAMDDLAEELAYDEVLRHARQFTAAELEQAARRDIGYADLTVPARLSYKLELVYLEGRLRKLSRGHLNAVLRESGVPDVYEAWVFPRGEWNPVCVFVTELPPGLAPQASRSDEIDRWVAVAGYSFKLLQYESEAKNPRTPDRNKMMQAPVLIGRALREIPPPADADHGRAWREFFLPAVVIVAGGLAGLLVGLGWWFRRGDRAVRDQIDHRRDRNPFSEGVS